MCLKTHYQNGMKPLELVELHEIDGLEMAVWW